jgi:3-dehydroquinate synthase
MDIIKVEAEQSKYKIYINNNFNEFYEIFEEYNKANSKIFIITDNKVLSLYSSIIEEFKRKYSAKVFNFPEGEDSKHYGTVDLIYDFLIENNADRKSIIISFGGGIAGDIAGFAAATFVRGIRFVSIPTTIISQVDSSIGGKVGYNFKGIKNAVGSFYNPEFVYISSGFLRTLSEEQKLEGMGEIIKYGLIKSRSLIEYIVNNREAILSLEEVATLRIIKECLNIKAAVVSEDFKDTGLRNILNFGHTVGHGIEVSSKYTISHGIAVALGILPALRLSERLLGLDEDIYEFIIELYKKIGLPTRYKVDNYDSFLYAIKHDKKNTDEINFVLLKDMEQCKIKIPVEEEELIWAINNSICQ